MTCLHKKLYHTQKNQATANTIPFKIITYSVCSDSIRTLTILTGLAFLAGL